jgi:hypothetical protein
MSRDDQLAEMVRQYLASNLSFDDLFMWVEYQEPYWGELPEDSPARSIAGIVSLMAYEVWDGARPELEAREIIRQETQSLVGT